MENLKTDLIRLSEALALGYRKLNKDLYNERCIEVVCDTFGVDLHQLFGRTRVRHITYCRFILFDYMYNYGKFTLQYIGSIFNRSHSMVMHGNKSHKDLLKVKDPIYLEMVEQFKVNI